MRIHKCIKSIVARTLYNTPNELNNNLKFIKRGYLNVFEQMDLNYFEELENIESELRDVIKFGYRTMEEIGLEAEEKC